MFLFIVLQIIAAVATETVVFQDCGSAYDLETVNIAGCGRRLPCYITLGEQVPVTAEFYADFASFQLDQNVVININFIDMKAQVTPEPCEIALCPVPTGGVTSITSVMTVPNDIALNQRGWLNWQMYNERNQLVLCYSVMVQTQSLLQKLHRHRINVNNTNTAGSKESEKKLNGKRKTA